MQILYTPMFSKKNLNSDSNYVLLANFVRRISTLRPEWHVYVPWPNSSSGFLYDSDGLFHQSNVTRIPMSFYFGRHLETLAFLPRQWKKLTNSLMYHAHWCNDIEKAGAYRSLVQSSDEVRKPVLIGHHHYMIHPSTGYDIHKDEPILFRQLSGSFICDKVVFNSKHCRGMFTDMASEYLSRKKITKIMDKSCVIYLGPALDGLDKRSKKPEDVVTFVYNHRLQKYKNYQQTFEVFQDLWDSGHRFRVIVTSTSNKNAIKVKKHPFVDFRICLTHDKYLKTLAEADVNVTNSQHETFCISAVESMMLGQLLVAPNGVTFPEITGSKSNGYPLLFRSVEDQKKILVQIIQNRNKMVEKWGPVLKSHVVENFNQHQWAISHIELIESMMAKKPEAKTNEAALDAFVKAAKKNNGKPVPVFLRDLLRENYFNLGQSWPMFRVLKQLNQLGFSITNKGGIQHIRKC